MAKLQKFPIGAKIKVADELNRQMSHFPKGFNGIVVCSYSQDCGREGMEDMYRLIVLNDYDEPIGRFGWYPEEYLTLISEDVENGNNIITHWNETML